jgi:hypothetical protein
MADNIRESFDRGLRQEQPRKAPAKRRGGWLYVVTVVVVLLAAGAAALYFLNPSWLPFFAGPKDIVLESGSRIVFDGLATEMTAGQGNTVVQGVAEEGRTTVIIRSRRKNARAIGTTEGAYVQLKPDVSSELTGKRVRVTVWARAGVENPSTLFAVAYSRGASGTTGWIAFDPSKEIKPYTFVYRVPAAATQNATGDYVGVWSDVSGLGGALEVRLITVQVIG